MKTFREFLLEAKKSVEDASNSDIMYLQLELNTVSTTELKCFMDIISKYPVYCKGIDKHFSSVWKIIGKKQNIDKVKLYLEKYKNISVTDYNYATDDDKNIYVLKNTSAFAAVDFYEYDDDDFEGYIMQCMKKYNISAKIDWENKFVSFYGTSANLKKYKFDFCKKIENIDIAPTKITL